jgi:hypothetical protein
MEGEAMRPLNRLGNIFFAKCLSCVLDVRLGDSLCGTKLLTRSDYDRILAWRRDFGDFDPFGDFELLFPAAVLGLALSIFRCGTWPAAMAAPISTGSAMDFNC